MIVRPDLVVSDKDPSKNPKPTAKCTKEGMKIALNLIIDFCYQPNLYIFKFIGLSIEETTVTMDVWKSGKTLIATLSAPQDISYEPIYSPLYKDLFFEAARRYRSVNEKELEMGWDLAYIHKHSTDEHVTISAGPAMSLSGPQMRQRLLEMTGTKPSWWNHGGIIGSKTLQKKYSGAMVAPFKPGLRCQTVSASERAMLEEATAAAVANTGVPEGMEGIDKAMDKVEEAAEVVQTAVDVTETAEAGAEAAGADA